MNILLDPDTVSAALSSFQGILSEGGVEKVDDATVVFHLEQGFADFPYLVASTNYDCLILPSDYQPGTWQKNPVGTGPFMLTAYTPKQSATLKKNPELLAAGLPYLDGVEVGLQRRDAGAGTRRAVGDHRHDAGRPPSRGRRPSLRIPT